MDRFLHLNLSHFWCKGGRRILAFFWFSGLLLGLLVTIYAGDSFLPMMRTAVLCRVSISGLLFAILLPFLLSALAVFASQPWLIGLIAFSKSFLFMLLAAGVSLAYGTGGWLVRILFMFGDICSLPLLWFFWLRRGCGGLTAAPWYCAVVGALAAAACCMDFYVISPFLTDLILF